MKIELEHIKLIIKIKQIKHNFIFKFSIEYLLPYIFDYFMNIFPHILITYL